MHDTLQLVIATLGILSQLVLLGKQFYGTDKATDAGQPTSQPQTSGAPLSTSGHDRTRLDLSFVLICSAFFSLLLTDSLLISGRNPSPGFGTIISVLFITVVIVTTMYAAWRMKRAELVTGYLAITTLIVLIISSGGPFFHSESDAVAGLSLLVPILSLVTLTAAMFIYALGNPLSRTIEKKRRLIVSAALLTLVLISAVALGQQLVIDVTNDPRTPAIKSPEAQALSQSMMREGLTDRRKFYKLASEVTLAPVYQKYFRTIAQEQDYTRQSTERQNSEVDVPAAGPTPLPSRTSSGQPARPGNEGRANSNRPSPTANPPPTASKPVVANPTVTKSGMDRQVVKRMMEDAYNRGDLETYRALEKVYWHTGSELEVMKSEGVHRTAFLINFFEALDMNNKQKYITERLNWIHPAGLASQSEATVPLQGTTAEQRFVSLSTFRMFSALQHQPLLRKKMLKEFEGYPPDIDEYFNELDRRLNSRTRLLDLTLERNSEYDKPTLFPKVDSNINNAQLQTQLGLPTKEEAYVAYREYQILASILIKQEFKERVEEHKLDALSAAFNNMDDVSQDAFLVYVINNKRIATDKVYQMLVDFKDIDFSAMANPGDQLVAEKLLSIFDGKRLNDKGLVDLSEPGPQQ